MLHTIHILLVSTFILIVGLLVAPAFPQQDIFLDEADEGAVAVLESTPIIYNDRHQPHDQEDESGGQCHGEDECRVCHHVVFFKSGAKVKGNSEKRFPLLQNHVSYFQNMLYQVFTRVFLHKKLRRVALALPAGKGKCCEKYYFSPFAARRYSVGDME